MLCLRLVIALTNHERDTGIANPTIGVIKTILHHRFYGNASDLTNEVRSALERGATFSHIWGGLSLSRGTPPQVGILMA